MRKGIELRRTGHDQEALELFKRVQDIDHDVRSLAQMGLAEQALGVWTDAEVHITAALARQSDPWIAKNHGVIQEALAVVGAHLGSLDVWGTPSSAEVLVGGRQAGVLPLKAPLRTTAGTVEIRVRAPGYVELARVIEVPARGIARERFELPKKTPLNLGATESPAPAPSAVAAGPQLVEAHPERVEPASAGRPLWKRWWFWTAVGAVAIGAGATVYLFTRPADCSGQLCTPI